jgi:hypothetical protein
LKSPLASFLVVYSPFVPQIVSTLIWPIPKKSDHCFCCLIALSRLLHLCFVYRSPSPAGPMGSRIFVFAIAVYLFAQLAVIFILDHFLATLDRLFPLSSANLTYAENRDANSICPICYEHLDNGETAIIAPCSHAFHRECHLEWTEGNLNCPTCCAYLPDPH